MPGLLPSKPDIFDEFSFGELLRGTRESADLHGSARVAIVRRARCSSPLEIGSLLSRRRRREDKGLERSVSLPMTAFRERSRGPCGLPRGRVTYKTLTASRTS
jgi:hypothetical protein